MLAVLYDIHGNLDALQRTLRDAENAGVVGFILGGDYSAFGPQPLQTLQACDALAPQVMLRGNHERWLTDPSDLPPNPAVPQAIQAQLDVFDEVTVQRLAQLELTHTRGDTLFCHAAPHTDMASFLPDPAPADADLLAGVTARRVVFGHLHVQFRRFDQTTGIELIAPGSVGLPLDGDPRPAYALLDPSTDELELRRVG